MPGGLQFVLILPDGSKSLIPAAWTDFDAAGQAGTASQLVGSMEDLLRMRSLVDALLRRRDAAMMPATGTADPARPAAQGGCDGHVRRGEALIRSSEQTAQTDRRPGSGASAGPAGARGNQPGDDR